MEPDGSLPCSQEPAIGPYPDPDVSIPHFPTLFPWDPFYIFPSTPVFPEWSFPFRFSNQNTICISHLSNACYKPCSFHPPWYDHLNIIWWNVQVMKLHIMRFSLSSCYLLSLRSKYSPQLTFLKQLLSTFFHWWERLHFTTKQNNK
jgi:hypothetical protein